MKLMTGLFATIILVAVISLFALRLNMLPALLPSALSSNLPFAADAPVGYDPLSAYEMSIVEAAAQQSENDTSQAAVAAGVQELLLVERHEVSKAERAKGNWPRQGDVYVYDYTTDTLIHSIVDVQSGTVITVEHVQGVQLPLTVNEEARALALIQADSTFWSGLVGRYQTITGKSLESLDQLQVKVSVFHADAMPDQVNGAAQHCGQHRCAQVLIFTVDKTLLEMTPIVDLSLGQVVQVLGEN